jgi:peptidoglycan-associated lipoprotein
MQSRWMIIALAAPLFAACAHATTKAAPEAPPVAAPVAMEAPAAPPVAASEEPRECSGDDQCGASELCVASRCVPIASGMAECNASAHFNFDRTDLQAAELPRLQRVARCLKALPQERTLVEGNCDERGAVQYNIALGFRRAHATAKYLEELGIPPSRLSEVSYGKELPLCAESTESCWATNRRADVTHGTQPKNVAAKVRADERRDRHARSTSRTTGAQPASVGAHGSQGLREQPSTTEAASPTR